MTTTIPTVMAAQAFEILANSRYIELLTQSIRDYLKIPANNSKGDAAEAEPPKSVLRSIASCDQLTGPNYTIQPILRAADRAFKQWSPRLIDYVPPVSWLRGIKIHVSFAEQVKALGGMYDAEVSYKNGVPVPYGTPGSIRADAVYGPVANPWYAVELKSGLAVPTATEIRRYYENLPPGTGLCAIVESAGQ